MFSKSLFKQSCKASGTMWLIITLAVCFMLASVMLITGNGDIVVTKNAIQNTIIKDELHAGIENRAINYYYMSEVALEKFDNKYREEFLKKSNQDAISEAGNKAYEESIKNGDSTFVAEIARGSAKYAKSLEVLYAPSAVEVVKYAKGIIDKNQYPINSKEAEEIAGLMITMLNPPLPPSKLDEIIEKMGITDSEILGMVEKIKKFNVGEFYMVNGEPVPKYDTKYLESEDFNKDERKVYRSEYSITNSPVYLSGNAILSENIQFTLDSLKQYGVTIKHYEDFGFTNYGNVKNIAISALINFKANYDYRMTHIKEGESEEKIVEELVKDVAQSLLSSLPHEVADALEEIGQLDLFGTLIGSIFFKMAGLLLPIIYLIMTANSLIAGQVDSGSMAYILSSSVKRRTVVVTQAVFLVGSLFAMFLCTSVTSVVCLAIVNLETELTFGKILLLNLGAFLVLFAMSGICFLTSCWFNRSKNSMAIGGGLNMFFLVATMLGLFGSSILPSIVRMEALNIFNYLSIISFFDAVSIMSGSLTYLWKLGILVVIGVVCYFIGSKKFQSKDLPL